MKKYLEWILKKNREVSGLFLFISLFATVILLYIILNFFTGLSTQYFYLFLIIALLFFIIDPFLKTILPSAKANLLLLEIYVFFVHFTVTYSGDNSISFFFLYFIPIISGAMSFGIRGSVGTTLFIFILYNLSPDPVTRNVILFGPQVQAHLPRFIALLIIAIMLGFSSEENRKAEQRAYERMSKIVTLNEIKNSLKLDYELVSILKVTTNSIVKIMNCNAGAGIVYDNMTGEIIDKYEKDLDIPALNKGIIRVSQEPELFGPKDKAVSTADLKKIRNILKVNVHIENERYLIIYLTKLYEKNSFNVSDVELIKTVKVYLELLFKNRALYKRIESIKDYLY
nr:hypothetical protein [bacterium]